MSSTDLTLITRTGTEKALAMQLVRRSAPLRELGE